MHIAQINAGLLQSPLGGKCKSRKAGVKCKPPRSKGHAGTEGVRLAQRKVVAKFSVNARSLGVEDGPVESNAVAFGVIEAHQQPSAL